MREGKQGRQVRRQNLKSLVVMWYCSYQNLSNRDGTIFWAEGAGKMRSESGNEVRRRRSVGRTNTRRLQIGDDGLPATVHLVQGQRTRSILTPLDSLIPIYTGCKGRWRKDRNKFAFYFFSRICREQALGP